MIKLLLKSQKSQQNCNEIIPRQLQMIMIKKYLKKHLKEDIYPWKKKQKNTDELKLIK